MLCKIYSILYTLCNTIYIIHCYWLWLLPVAMTVAGPYTMFTLFHDLHFIIYYLHGHIICLYDHKAMCKLYNYKAVWLYGKMAVWLQGYKPRREKAMGLQSNIAIWQIYMVYGSMAIRLYTLIALGYYIVYYILYNIYSIFYILYFVQY